MLDPLSYYVIRKCRVTIGLLPNLSLTAIKLRCIKREISL